MHGPTVEPRVFAGAEPIPTVSRDSVTREHGVRIYYEVYGSGAPVVLVAGLGDDRMSWEQQICGLAPDHLVIVIDNRGIGNSSVPGGPYSIAQMAEDCHAVITALELADVTAVGSSMGGAICQAWALAHPPDIERLVLTNTWAKHDAFLDALFNHWIRLGEANAGRQVMESLLLFCFSPEYLDEHPEVMTEFVTLDPPPMRGFIGAAHACRRHDLSEALASISQPTLVIGGERDILTRPELAHHLAEGLATAQLALVPAGHMLFWEQPTHFLELVREFVATDRPDSFG